MQQKHNNNATVTRNHVDRAQEMQETQWQQKKERKNKQTRY
jgi:hypothetical protein